MHRSCSGRPQVWASSCHPYLPLSVIENLPVSDPRGFTALKPPSLQIFESLWACLSAADHGLQGKSKHEVYTWAWALPRACHLIFRCRGHAGKEAESMFWGKMDLIWSQPEKQSVWFKKGCAGNFYCSPSRKWPAVIHTPSDAKTYLTQPYFWVYTWGSAPAQSSLWPKSVMEKQNDDDQGNTALPSKMDPWVQRESSFQKIRGVKQATDALRKPGAECVFIGEQGSKLSNVKGLIKNRWITPPNGHQNLYKLQ